MAKKKRNRTLLYVLIGLIVIAIVAAIFKKKSTPSGELVETEKVEKRTIKEMVSASGKIFPEKEVKISSDVSGEIVELYVEEGDSVELGQLLAKIDPDAYLSAVERGEATVNNARSQLAISRSQVENSKAQLEQIKSQLRNAEKIHKRNVQLKDQGVISDADFETSQSNFEVQKANLRAAEASVRSSEQGAEAAVYSVKSAAASLKELRTSLQRTSIFSPTSGIVSMLNVEQGERVVGTIQMTGTEMMRIANLNNMEVQVEVTENDIMKVGLGHETEIEVDAYLDKKFMGKVTEIANSAANAATAQSSLTSEQVTNFIVKIRIDPDSYADIIKEGQTYAFRPGMSATVNINTKTVDEVLSIPIQAVTTRDLNKEADEDKPKVKKVSETDEEKDDEELEEVVFIVVGDTVAMSKVETGIQDDEYIHVLAGVKENDEIVTGPYRTVSKKLKSGMKIRTKDKDEKKKKDKNKE